MGTFTWFGEIDGSTGTRFSGTPAERARRAATARPGQLPVSVPSWEEILASGTYSHREHYLADLRELTCLLAREGVLAHTGSPETHLATLVRYLADLDKVVALLETRACELDTLSRAIEPWGDVPPAKTPGQPPAPVQAALRSEIDALKKLRRQTAGEVSALALRVLPNCSALCGGLVAARLMNAAGSLDTLSRLPASSIQVLGAKSALFAHLQALCPSPKHGILYEHKRVHAAPKNRRGRVSRTLAAQVAIAARIDRFRGTADPGFLAKADLRVARSREER